MPKVAPAKKRAQAASTPTRQSPRKRGPAAVEKTPVTPQRQSQRTAPTTPESPTVKVAKRARKKKTVALTVIDSDEDEDDGAPVMMVPSSPPPPWTPVSSPTVVAPSSPAMPQIVAKKKNRWASTNNVLYGHVENANVGKLPYKLPRKRPLREGIQYTNGQSASRFKVLMGDVIMRAEKASHETGGWIYVVGQHPHAIQAHVSYISPRLRREASTTVLSSAHKQVVNMVHSCKVSHRKTAQNLSTELLAREEELAEARRTNAAQAAELRELKKAAADLAGPVNL
ncbi:hypothetical protein C8J56DRAFT_1053033 [Mycena floridula]|nr:hypothetical protein C8J56DRAFT_1053033 [Mycena floridula]